jgi:hypothetical protein
MTKIKIETYKTKKQEIPVQRIGKLALASDPKEVRRADYLRSDTKQDHGSRPAYRYKDKHEKSLADKRAEALDGASKLSSSQLLSLANEISAQEGYGENGQELSERPVVWSSEKYDGDDDEAAEVSKVEFYEDLMGAGSDLDEEIRTARYDLKKSHENKSLDSNPNNDQSDLVLDGINIKNERPNQ